jgi:hypothetical protein
VTRILRIALIAALLAASWFVSDGLAVRLAASLAEMLARF